MASAVSQRIQQFIRSIPEDIKLYQQLIPLLQQQKTLYLKFDGEALSNNVQKQMPILNKLSRSASDRSQCMRELGLACNDASVKRIFNAL
ncbi:flagellar export chaperone FlgN, partial [Vibrio diabolicus]